MASRAEGEPPPCPGQLGGPPGSNGVAQPSREQSRGLVWPAVLGIGRDLPVGIPAAGVGRSSSVLGSCGQGCGKVMTRVVEGTHSSCAHPFAGWLLPVAMCLQCPLPRLEQRRGGRLPWARVSTQEAPLELTSGPRTLCVLAERFAVGSQLGLL